MKIETKEQFLALPWAIRESIRQRSQNLFLSMMETHINHIGLPKHIGRIPIKVHLRTNCIEINLN